MGDQDQLQSKLNLAGCCLVQCQGTINQEHTSVNLFTAYVLQTEASEASLDERLKLFWDLETLGIRNDECSVYDHFMENIRFHDGRYCVRLPWKDPHCMLPENYDLSQKRLYGLLNRLRHHTGLLREYDGIIRDQIAKGDCGNRQEPVRW